MELLVHNHLMRYLSVYDIQIVLVRVEPQYPQEIRNSLLEFASIVVKFTMLNVLLFNKDILSVINVNLNTECIFLSKV